MCLKKFINNNDSWVNVEQFESFRKRAGLVWHHHEDLETMVLIDGRIHGGIGHWGSGSILKKLTTETYKNYWKRLLSYEQ